VSDDTRDANVHLSADVTSYQQSVGAATQDTHVLIQAVDTLSARLDGLGRRTSKKITLFAAADLAMMGGMVAMTATYEKQLSSLAGQSAITGRSMSGMSDSIRQMTRDLPTARGELVATATAISKMGVTSGKDIAGLALTFTKTAAAAGESAIGIAQSMTTLSRQMGTLAGGATQMQKFTDSLLHVSAVAGVSAQSVADFSNSIAPIARVAGMSQTQIIGMSAAFVQAGNDGYAAANTFNTMLADITRTTAQGGPGLGKYASLLGMTVKQFQSMPAADQITGIFKAINDAGPKSIAILDSMGIDGIKAARAIQTMAAQSGGLEKLIQTATGSYGDNSTNTGSAAAMGGLVDQMDRFKNIAQDMGTSIGSGVIMPLTGALNVLNNILGQAAKVTGVFASGGVLAGAGGLVSGGAGIVGTVASYAAVPATLNWLRNTKTARGFMEARQAGIANRLGLPIATGPALDRYTAGTAGPIERRVFEAGAGLGNQFGAPGTGAPLWQRALGVPVRLAGSLANAQRDFYRESRVPGFERAQGGDAYAAAKRAVTANESLTRAMYNTTKAVLKMEAAAAGAGVSAIKTGLGAPLKAMGTGALNLLGGPAGVALMAGMGAVAYKGQLDARRDELTSRTSADYTLSTAYTTHLGMAATVLSGFSDTVSKASDSVLSLSDAAAQASKAGYRTTPINPNVASITTPQQGAAYLNSLGTRDPKVIKDAMIDVRSVLPGQAGDQALTLFNKEAGSSKSATLNDVTTLLPGTHNTDSNGIADWFKVNVGGSYGSVGDKSSGGIQNMFSAANAYVSSFEKYGPQAQQQAKLLAVQKILDYVGGEGTLNPAERQEVYTQLAAFGGMKIDVPSNSFSGNYGHFTATEFLAQYGQDVNVPSMGQTGAAGEVNLANLMKTQTSPQEAALNAAGYGPSGTPLAGVNSDTGTPSDPNSQARAVQYAYSQSQTNVARQVAAARAALAKRLGVKVTDPRVTNAITVADFQGQNLQNVAGISGVTPDSIYGGTLSATQSAQSLVGSDLSLQATHQTRAQRLTSAATRYQLANDANNDTNNLDPNKFTNMQQRKAEYQTQLASYTQYLNQMVQTQEQFKLQMARSEHDYYQQRTYAQQDFQRQSGYAAKDFAKSMLRQAQDSAKTIYNPFQRVQSQYTTDVGTLKQNLTEQTKMIRKQTSNLRRLKALGLSQASINMLDLANPANAQQVEELVQEMSKRDASQINAQTSSRQSASNGLTQSDLNQGYTRQVADFKTSVARSVTEYQIGMDRMATAHVQQVARAKQDLALMSKEYVDDFTTAFNKAQTLVKANLGKTANITMGELQAIKSAFPEFFTSLPNTSANSSAVAAGNAARSQQVPRQATTRTATAAQRAASSSVGVISSSVSIGNMYVTASKPADIAKAIADRSRSNKLKGLIKLSL
jgi:TP901 family phage tail tape measure protein